MNRPRPTPEELKRAFCTEIDVVERSPSRFSIFTPFAFDDGDHFVIELLESHGQWRYSDRGHTFMHMSYTDVDFTEGTRRKLIDEVLAAHEIVDTNGDLCLSVRSHQFGEALFSFVHAISKITQVVKFTRNVESIRPCPAWSLAKTPR